MDGLVLIDKPRGMTSFDVVSLIREVTGQSTVGHMGTLDRAATGLLVVLVGRSTKLQQYLAEKVSVYDFEMRFGVQTDTLDAEGELVDECAYGHIDAEAIRQALSGFVGRIEQKPPKYSAIQIEGRRSSEWARDEQLEDVEPEARQVEIRSLELLDYDPPAARFRIECVSGTYVRSLVRDLAAVLETCAHATAIRRVRTNDFSVEKAVSIDQLDEATVREHLTAPVEMVAALPTYELDHEEARLISFGTPVEPRDAWLEQCDLEPGEPVRLVDGTGELAAVARIRCRDDQPELQPRRVMKPAQQ